MKTRDRLNAGLGLALVLLVTVCGYSALRIGRSSEVWGVAVGGTVFASLVALLLGLLLRRDFGRRQKSEALYQSVIDVLAEGVFVRDTSGIIVQCNPSAERILGLPREQIIGMPQGAIACFREDGTPMPLAARPGVAARQSSGSSRSEVMGIRRPDGEMRWLLVNAAPMYVAGTNKVLGVTTSFADITRRKEAEATVSDHRTQLQDFLEHADELILIANADGRMLYANRAWRDTLGYTDKDVVGHLVTEYLDPDCRHRYDEDLRRLISGETLHNVETTFVARDGRRVAVSGNSNCRFEHGIPVATRSIFRDMTEMNVAQEQLLLAIQQASEASRAKSEFLANMSHELRTPLNSVIGFSNVLMRNKGGHLDAQDALYINRIYQNGRHLLGLINNILDLSKVEAGRMDLEIAPLDLDALTRETLAQLESQVHGRPVALRAIVPEHLAPFSADAGKLKQVLINLVANALKFTETGSVTVRVIAGPGRRPAGIEVVDTGIGIPLDRQAAVFDAFRQADNSTARRFGGSGLGLTITRSLCQLMGYQIGLQSAPGVGTTFTVTFGSEPAATTGAVESGGGAQAGTGRVLIIDDDPDARLLLSQYVRDAGFEALTTGTGEQGLALAATVRPALILLDIMMPQMNGLEVLERLRTDPALSGIPVVIVSIVASESRRRALGAAALIDKPVQREEIELVLRSYVADPADPPGRLGDLIRHTLVGQT